MAQKTANPLINTFLVFSVGLSALELAQLIFDPANASSLTTLAFDEIFLSMFQGMFLSADGLTSFWAVLVAWGISGGIAGIRAKNQFWGGFAGFLGTLLGAGFLLLMNSTVFSNPSGLFEFGLGTLICAVVASITAGITGSATKTAPVKSVRKERTRKAWVSSKEKTWTCNRCGSKIPPGAFSCPNCGEAVIE